MFDIKGKNVVYFGGFTGVGHQICRVLMKKEISHLVICHELENVEMLKKLQAEGPAVEVSFVHINIMDRMSIAKGVKQIVDIVKHVDVLINGADVLADKNVETTIGVNLVGLINTTLAILPWMDKSQHGKGGLVVNIASVYSVEPAPALAVYAASKHGVIGFSRSMADTHNYDITGVNFICVLPGLTSTEQMVNLRENMTIDHLGIEWVNAISKVAKQSPEECAIHIVKVMEIMKNGAMYICSKGQMKEIVPQVHWTM